MPASYKKKYKKQNKLRWHYDCQVIYYWTFINTKTKLTSKCIRRADAYICDIDQVDMVAILVSMFQVPYSMSQNFDMKVYISRFCIMLYTIVIRFITQQWLDIHEH